MIKSLSKTVTTSTESSVIFSGMLVASWCPKTDYWSITGHLVFWRIRKCPIEIHRENFAEKTLVLLAIQSSLSELVQRLVSHDWDIFVIVTNTCWLLLKLEIRLGRPVRHTVRKCRYWILKFFSVFDQYRRLAFFIRKNTSFLTQISKRENDWRIFQKLNCDKHVQILDVDNSLLCLTNWSVCRNDWTGISSDCTVLLIFKR